TSSADAPAIPAAAGRRPAGWPWWRWRSACDGAAGADAVGSLALAILAALTMSQPDPDAARVLPLLRRHGWNATSFQSLEEGFRYDFQGPDACVPYVDTGRAWVAAGAPIASPRR